MLTTFVGALWERVKYRKPNQAWMTTSLREVLDIARDVWEGYKVKHPERVAGPAHYIATLVVDDMKIAGSPGARLVDAINDCAELAGLKAGWIQTMGMGMAVSPHAPALSLLLALREGPQGEKEWLDGTEISHTQSCSVTNYAAVCGVAVSQAISLSHNLDIKPIESLPAYARRPEFEKLDFSKLPGFPTFYDIQRPRAASVICLKGPVKRVLFSGQHEAPSMELSESFIALATDVINCLSALGLAPVAILGVWSELDNFIFRSVAGKSTQYLSPSHSDPFLFAKSSKPSPVDASELEALYRQWTKLPAKDQAVLRVALSRLNSATTRDLVDRAIDLGVSMESMLLNEMNGEQGELSYRLSMRGAAFVGGSHSDRVKRYNTLRKAYSLRSRAVHSGAFKPGKELTTVEETLREAMKCAAEIARAIIERGGFPSWDTDYVIGGSKV